MAMTRIGWNLPGTIMIPLYFIVQCIVYYVGFSVINISEDTEQKYIIQYKYSWYTDTSKTYFKLVEIQYRIRFIPSVVTNNNNNNNNNNKMFSWTKSKFCMIVSLTVRLVYIFYMNTNKTILLPFICQANISDSSVNPGDACSNH